MAVPNNGKLSNIPNETTYKVEAIGISSVPKLLIEIEEPQLESHSNSEIKTISDHKKQVSKTWSKLELQWNPDIFLFTICCTYLKNIQYYYNVIFLGEIRYNRFWT